MENFNVEPYHDDFDASKNFHRILFKPGFAVQARELTQSQTILQDQISKFADNIFTQNTPVSGGKVTTNLNCYYIKLNTQYSGVDIVASDFLNKTITDSTGTVVAKVIATIESTGTTTDGEPPTLIVSYLSGVQFKDSSTIYPTDGTNINATTIGNIGGTTCTGKSSVASISAGIFYVVNGYSTSEVANADGTFSKYSIGNFVSVQPQTIVLDKYSSTPSYRVGLQITETVYDYISDPSLLDPAIGASNYQAPGADRYVITLTLSSISLSTVVDVNTNLSNDGEFIELVRIKNGSIIKQIDGTVYSTINDYFAKRDYETNGDYIVDDFKLTPSINATDSSKYNLSVGTGIAYVHGYRVENQSPITLVSDRARTTSTINNNSVYVNYGNYFVVNSVGGTFDTGVMPQVDFHCVTSGNVNRANTTTYNSTLVGSGFFRDLNYVSGTGGNTKAYLYNAFVSDIIAVTLAGTISAQTTNTLTVTDAVGAFSSTANAYYGSTITLNTGTDSGDRLHVSGYSASGSAKTFTFSAPFILLPTIGDTFTLSYDTTNINSIIKVDASKVLIANCDINVQYGKVNGVFPGYSIFNTTNTPELVFPIGYPYVSNLTGTNYSTTKVYRNKTVSGSGVLTLTANNSHLQFLGSGTITGSTTSLNFTVIDRSANTVLDYTANTITISSGKDSATLSNTAYAGKVVDVIANMSVINGDSATDVLKSKSLIAGNTVSVSSSFTSIGGTYIKQDLTKGQIIINYAGVSTNSAISLYVTDVKKIKKIIASGTTSDPTGSISNYTDITNKFFLDNGQRDSYYDFASITLRPGMIVPVGSILVVFDYYSHTSTSSGDGYFSVMSYLSPISSSPEAYKDIPTYTAKNGLVYSLSDCLDFRPSRVNGQTGYVWEYSNTQAYNNDIGVFLPSNLSNFIGNYSYYLARKDKLILTKDGSFTIINGTPSVTAAPPVEPEGSLILANISLDPYTAYVPGENPPTEISNLSINRVGHKRWAKSDITGLETRVNNLEYYTSLNLLEQNAQSLQISDQNGLNRFKNGILVDDFSSYATADTSNIDYMANIDIRNKKMSPLTYVNNYQLQNPVVVNSLGTVANTQTYAIASINGTQTNVFTLPYTTSNVIVQQLASSVVSVNPFGVTVYQGVALLSPPMDNWVDNQQSPAVVTTDPTLQSYQQTSGVNLVNSSDFASIPGTSYSSSETVEVVNNDTFVNTSTYNSVLQNLTVTPGTSAHPQAFDINNDYITNIAILPYIRPQQVIVKSRGLLNNTPIKTWFDGVNVDRYIKNPSTIEVSNTTGTFNEDDIVGFYVNPTFYPIARVISVYNYPNGTSCRLYVANIINSPKVVVGGADILQNATFDANGNYAASTARGTIASNQIASINYSGTVLGVGGTYTASTNTATSGTLIKSPTDSSYCDFLNQYGVWGQYDTGTTYSPYQAAFPFSVTSNGTYTIVSSADNYATVYLNGGAFANNNIYGTGGVAGPTTTYTQTLSLVKNVTYYISWASTRTDRPSTIGIVIRDASGNQVFNTVHPPGLVFNTVGSANTEVVMTHGGAWFTGITSLLLDSNASANANYYVGSTITVSSTYIYDVEVGSYYVPPPPAPSGGGGHHDWFSNLW